MEAAFDRLTHGWHGMLMLYLLVWAGLQQAVRSQAKRGGDTVVVVHGSPYLDRSGSPR